MAAKKKSKKAPTSSSEAHRVNMTFTPEEYELLVAAAAKDSRPPTVMAKLLIMKALAEGPVPTDAEAAERPSAE